MQLVVDANILFSFFNPRSLRRSLINSLSRTHKLISPEYVFEELLRDKSRIMKASDIDASDFILFLSFLEMKMVVVPVSEYNSFMKAAEECAPHKKDLPYFALALSCNCPIWSDEKDFQTQSRIKAISTSEISKLF